MINETEILQLIERLKERAFDTLDDALMYLEDDELELVIEGVEGE